MSITDPIDQVTSNQITVPETILESVMYKTRLFVATIAVTIVGLGVWWTFESSGKDPSAVEAATIDPHGLHLKVDTKSLPNKTPLEPY